MDLQLNNRNAVVLGGTRGIGLAIAETFANESANVAICARHAAPVDKAVSALRGKGVRATGAAVDISDGAALRRWIESAGDELGGIDVLVSNAGAMSHGNDPAAWEANFRLDILGAVNAFEAARPLLETAAAMHGDAAFVIISSVSAAESEWADSYGPIKAALIHWAKGLAHEYAKQRIRTNVVSPGMVYFKGGVWNRIEEKRPEAFKEAMARNPTGRAATPQEIANAVVFLASPVSSYTTGINLIVDGAISRRVNF
jgi:3-oxoacyl-[acyl-carrier protein] reductase